MVDTQQVRANYRNEEEEEESPDPDTSQSRRRFKASNMSFGEMLEMVNILKKADYDGKKAKIMAKVVRSLHRNFGLQRSKDQLRKRWSDLKLREHEQYRKIRRVLQKKVQEEEEDVVEIVTTTGDRDVVDQYPFTSESAKILIGEIMGCNLELENLKKKIYDVIQKNKNIIDVLGRV
ncbi:hypothetical protein AB205_0116350 [Aquarana catesbeiana]|uniref:Myb/SANT-like DNA-binding domain-containing protein n=1 Tax=Aquarana catesbeiana TaxID=8400 RepID=A0A2G9RG28_AQUCT|nr:hypothetical protein AB205_0116350 [Aquarana catesbeiana]